MRSSLAQPYTLPDLKRKVPPVVPQRVTGRTMSPTSV